MNARYNTDDLIETQFQAGSNQRVLKNLLGIKSKRAMDGQEAIKLFHASLWAIERYPVNHRFSANDIKQMHKQWLGEIYPWAGEYRQVNISKGNFTFAMAAQVPRLMAEFERDVLARFTPCNFTNEEDVIEALAITHCELVLIHPFREGNGRASRLLTTIMALQAGLPILNFSGIAGKAKQTYFAAVQTGLSRDYEPMKKILSKVIAKSKV